MKRTITGIIKDIISYFKPTSKRGIIRLVILVGILIVASIFLSGAGKETVEESVSKIPIVKIASIQNIAAENELSLIGTVRAVSEAQIQSETGGRVTSVQVELGQEITAGQIIAQTKNASQRASVLQAEGMYEAALASAQSSNVSVSSAENSLRAALDTVSDIYNIAYDTESALLRNTIDTYFSNPDGQIVGVRLSGPGDPTVLAAARKELQNALPAWQAKTNTMTLQSDITTMLNDAKTTTNSILTIVDALIIRANDYRQNESFSGSLISVHKSTLTSARTTLNGQLARLNTGLTGVERARQLVEQAKIGGTSSEISSANAQVKQALGALQGAQANLNKTIMRSPIAGTVNSVSVNTGDFISAFTQVAEIANNNALEISTFVGESDRANISVGSPVIIDGGIDGVVTQVAPGVDSATQKTEVKVATESTELVNGDTVSIQLSASGNTESSEILLPITAFKFAAENGSVFTVDNGVLVAYPVELGDIRGAYVVVISGIDKNAEVVIDARGLSAGAKVETRK